MLFCLQRQTVAMDDDVETVMEMDQTSQNTALVSSDRSTSNENKNDLASESSIDKAKDRNDAALRLLGKPGRYALLVYGLGFCLNAFVAFNHVTLPSLYAVPILHRCQSRIDNFHDKNISIFPAYSVTNSSQKEALRCSEIIYTNNSTIQIACSKWQYIYIHGFAKTWVNQWNLVCNQRYMLSLGQSLYMTGVMLGSPVTGMASDRFGRRPILLICLLVSSALSILLAFIDDVYIAIVLRFITGFFISGVHSILYVSPMEMFPRSSIPFLSVAVMNSFAAGVFLGNGLIYFVREWRIAQLILCAPSVLLLVLVYFILSDSPSWALVSRKQDKYYGFFKNAMKINNLNAARRSEINDVLDQVNFCEMHAFKKKRTYTIFDLFKTSEIRRRSFLGIYLWFTCGISYYTLSYNLPNLSPDSFSALLVGSATDLPSFILAFLYIPRIGKRRSLMTVLFIGGLFCFIFKFVPNLAILLIGKMFLAVSFGIVFIYLPEIFPTVIRNIGVGTLSFFSRAGGLLAPQLVLIGTYTDVHTPVVVVGCLSIVGALLTIIAPETKENDLPDYIDDIEQG